MFLVLALTGSALALQQQRVYKSDDFATAEGVAAIQQHSVFVEIIVEEVDQAEQVHQFAAVVGLVKKCKQVRNAFDNAVLWFNDQFLFGNKSTAEVNVTADDRNNESDDEQAALGFNPEANLTGSIGDGNHSGFLSRNSMEARWGGCYIPNGFIHAIGSDDPYSTGNVTAYKTDAGSDDEAQPLGDNIDLTKSLLSLDGDCGGCIFEYVGTFYITDPNNHQWMIDKFVYPLNVAHSWSGEPWGAYPGLGDDPTNCHVDQNLGFGCGLGEDRHNDRAEDDGSPFGNNTDNHCNDADDGTECAGDGSDGQADGQVTTKEPLFTVHLQVDPANPDRQGFADEAIWAYRDGTQRLGVPYTGDPDEGANYTNTDLCKNHTTALECTIEYNFLIAVDFEAFDDTNEHDHKVDGARVHTQADGTGENELVANYKEHGEGGTDDGDTALQGNSHPHNPQNNTTGPAHLHDAVALDLFFSTDAPVFVEENPYWNNATDAAATTGTPPEVNDDCTSTEAGTGAAAHQTAAVEVRIPIVCDVDDADGYHLHDGSQTIRPS